MSVFQPTDRPARADLSKALGLAHTTSLRIGSLGRIQMLVDFAAASVAGTASMLTVRQPVLALILMVSWPCGIAVLGRRDGRATRLSTTAPWRWAVASMAALAVAESVTRSPGSVRVTVALALAVLASTAMRLLLTRSNLVPFDGLRESVVLIGGVDSVAEIAEQWNRAGSRLKPIGMCLNASDLPGGGLEVVGSPLPLLGSPSEAAASAERVDADVVAVLPGAGLSHSDLRRLAWALEPTRTRLCFVTPLQDVDRGRVRPRTEGGRLVLDVIPRRSRGWTAKAKSVVDWFTAVAMTVLALPVLAVLWSLVRLDSAGPALFRQTRIGTNGKAFTMFKLRTMYIDAEQRRASLWADNRHLDGPLFKIENDPRITRVGRILRRTSLDELPQLVNVLRGQMSLVGPRPALPDEVTRYDDWARRRLVVKPGITGLWQVSGRSNLGWSESVRLDLDYVDNWTPGMDARIAAKTAGAVFRREGAY